MVRSVNINEFSSLCQDANDSFNDWFQHFHNAKPRAPQNPTGANFSERVAFEHREKEFQMEMQRWRHTLLLQTRVKLKDEIIFLSFETFPDIFFMFS